MTARLGALMMCVALALTGCAAAASRPPTKSSCTPPAGGRCKGPEPIESVAVSADGRRLSTIAMCGGWLRAAETSTSVRVTYVASAVGPGAMSCALVRLTARLARPLGQRSVIDTTSGNRLTVTHCKYEPRRTRGSVRTACG